jgi:hypothetical protein
MSTLKNAPPCALGGHLFLDALLGWFYCLPPSWVGWLVCVNVISKQQPCVMVPADPPGPTAALATDQSLIKWHVPCMRGPLLISTGNLRWPMSKELSK